MEYIRKRIIHEERPEKFNFKKAFSLFGMKQTEIYTHREMSSADLRSRPRLRTPRIEIKTRNDCYTPAI